MDENPFIIHSPCSFSQMTNYNHTSSNLFSDLARVISVVENEEAVLDTYLKETRNRLRVVNNTRKEGLFHASDPAESLITLDWSDEAIKESFPITRNTMTFNDCNVVKCLEASIQTQTTLDSSDANEDFEPSTQYATTLDISDDSEGALGTEEELKETVSTTLLNNENNILIKDINMELE